MNTKSSVIIAVGVALAGLLLGCAIRSGFTIMSDRDRTITVRGLSERQVMANKVTWPLVYKIVGNDLQAIYSQIEANNRVIEDYLTSNGLTADEYSVNAPDITDKQADAYQTSEMPYRFSVSMVITVTSSKIDLVRNLISRQGELLKKGIAIIAGDWSYHTIYEYTELNDIKPGMIADATAAARKAAEKFSSDSGSKIGRLMGATQGQFSIDDRDPYTPYIKRVRVVTSMTYAIN